jgi:hypothetical protein
MIFRAESRFVKAIGIAVNHKPASMTVHEPELVIMNKMKNCSQMALAVKLMDFWQDDAARRIPYDLCADHVFRNPMASVIYTDKPIKPYPRVLMSQKFLLKYQVPGSPSATSFISAAV